MKRAIQDEKTWILQFDPGDELILEIENFCNERGVKAAHFSGIGSCKSLILSFYNLETKRYEDTEINERLEVVSLLGNVSKLDEETIVHCHGVFGDKNLNTKSGHVKKLVVSATCEIVLTALDGTLERKKDPNTGLNLIS